MLQLSNLDQARSHSMEIQNKDGTQFHLTIHDGSGCSGAAVRDSEALSGSARQSMVINIDVFYTHGKGRDLPFLFQSLRYLNFCFKWKISILVQIFSEQYYIDGFQISQEVFIECEDNRALSTFPAAYNGFSSFPHCSTNDSSKD